MIREQGEDWLTAAEAADRLGVSESTARTDAESGRIRGRDRGPGRRPRWVIAAADVERLVASGGRIDRRTSRTAAPAPAPAAQAEVDRLREQLDEANQRLGAAYQQVADMKAEVARLRVVARNANVSVQAQTESLQQYLVDEAD